MYHTNNNKPVARICNRKEMRTQLSKSSSFVLLHHVDIIQVWQSPERIDSYQNVPRVSLHDCYQNLSSVSLAFCSMSNWADRTYIYLIEREATR